MNYRDDFSIIFKNLYHFENINKVKANNKIESHAQRSKSQIGKKKVIKTKNNMSSITIKKANLTEDKYIKFEDDFYFENNKSKDSIDKQSLKSFLSKYINF